MDLHHLLTYKSATGAAHPCHFADPDAIQTALEKVCIAWIKYLQGFVNQTEKLFTAPELPWKGTERALVSSLGAAIIREFPSSLVVEEGSISKNGKVGWGRWDLWASIPNVTKAGTRFSFYLEAKKSGRSKKPAALSRFLTSSEGVSGLYRDYGKRHANPISKLSPYEKGSKRKHGHYVIGMLVTRLKAVKEDSTKIEAALQEVFENDQIIVLGNKSDGEVRERKRRLGRLPTVAIAVVPEDGQSGILASFTVFGSSSEFQAKGFGGKI